MKAIRFHEFGEVEVLKYEDVPDPVIGDDEVLVRVKAAALNHLDLRIRSGKSPRPVDLPHIGGVDIAGDVEAVGKNVTDVKPGTKVVIDPTVKTPKGPMVVGVNFYGGFAEYVKVPAVNAVPIPDEVSYDDAATLPICYVTAWYGLFDRGNMQKGETVLVHAAGSGTGSAAVQIAKEGGAFVIATAGSDEKLEKVKKLGADATVNYNTHDFAEEVKRITEGKGVDVIFDQIGASIWENNLKSLKMQGRILLVGVVGGGQTTFNFGPVIVRDLSVLGVTVFNAPRSNLINVINLVSLGRLRPVIDKRFPLSEAASAQKLLEDRSQFGKVVLNP
ncbi:MAG: zinc-binding dehydrogenase [Candidatus Dadabacteria bacterium]|nr:zinc-binding dehydrogenase [Candidatus Dadabacteria bacterium]